MMQLPRVLLFILCSFISSQIFSQSISGTIKDAGNGDAIIGAVVTIKGTTIGTATDIDGKFELKTSQPLPLTLIISYVGFQKLEIEVKSFDKPIVAKLKSKEIKLKDVDVVGSRISEKQKEAPLTVESIDRIAIKECAQTSFYESLGTLKGVDLTTASLGFTIVNTRGFNSTSPVRSLQLIDGVDNQSPGLNFSLGNFLGSSELDVLKVDMIAGASSAYFGPNAFNGVISITTRSPFVKPGLEVSVKVGERNLTETALRWAQVFKNKNGADKFGYKLNLFYMRAHDWEATNDDATPQSLNDKTNPGGYDAVNRYGDEYFSGNDDSGTGSRTNPGLGTRYRSGYWEKDLVDYNTENIKMNLSLHYKLKRDVEIILASSFGSGTTVYQGDNRFSLRDILFFQNRIEIRKENKFFIRAYSTNEDAGKSFDAYFTALLLQRAVKSDVTWSQDYRKYWNLHYSNPIQNYPGYPQPPNISDPEYSKHYTEWIYSINPYLLEHYYDSLVKFHDITRAWADGVGYTVGNTPFLSPGTAAFDSAFNAITSSNAFNEGGSHFYDKSALYHIQGEYKFTPSFSDITIGGNYRMYAPDSKGTIFSDTSGTKITNHEYGTYAGLEKRFLQNKLKLNLTSRFDKNDNFESLISPALSAVYSFKPTQIVRISFSSAIRNPTLTDQYLYYNVGRATLKGNIDGYDSLVTIPSLFHFFNSQNFDTLEYFNVPPVRPEKVQTLEVGYRGTILKTIFVDVVAYYSLYKDFIGYKIGADIAESPSTGSVGINNIYRVSANAVDEVTTMGTSIGINYYFKKFFSLNGNYSYNKLDRGGSTDPLIPAFNTPENKYNIGISGRDIDAYILKKIHLKNIGFSIHYKWIEGFDYEGSPQFTGYVPSYDLLDAQLNYRLQKIHTTFKLGASNLLDKKNMQVYGGPQVGRLAYFSLLVELTK